MHNKISGGDYYTWLCGFIKAMGKEESEKAVLLLSKYQKLYKSEYRVLSACRYIVMYNPVLFNPKSKSFDFPAKLKDIMYHTAKEYLIETSSRE